MQKVINLKKLTCKGTCGWCLSVWDPVPHTPPPPPLHTVCSDTVYLFEQGRGSRGELNQREGERGHSSQSWVKKPRFFTWCGFPAYYWKLACLPAKRSKNLVSSDRCWSTAFEQIWWGRSLDFPQYILLWALELETKNVGWWKGTERRRILLKLLDGSWLTYWRFLQRKKV